MGSSNPLHSDPAADQPELEQILTDLRALRDKIVTAWRERAVVLTSEERTELRDEIKQTCEFLNHLTGEH
jgi:hypothetical protein